jgi:hypothetical protein
MTNGVQILDGISGSQNYYAFFNYNIYLFIYCGLNKDSSSHKKSNTGIRFIRAI